MLVASDQVATQLYRLQLSSPIFPQALGRGDLVTFAFALAFALAVALALLLEFSKSQGHG
jgi:hypothetical protein